MSQELNFDQWVDIIVPILKDKKEHVLLALFSQVGWPSKGIFIEVLKQSSHVFSQDMMTRRDYSDSENDKSTDKRHNKNEDFWRSVMSHYQLNASFACKVPGVQVAEWMIGKRFDSALAEMVKNSSSIELQEWLSQKSDVLFFDSGHDKCSVLGSLVLGGAFPVLKGIAGVDPSLMNLLDKRGRSAFFYARSTAMVKHLMDAGVSTNPPNKDGQDLRSFWSSQFRYLPKINEWIPLLIHSNSSGSDQYIQKESLVHKIWSLDLDELSDQEKEEMERAAQNSDWRWEGCLAGVTRQWSLPELFMFGKLSLALRLSPPPSFLTKKGYPGLHETHSSMLSHHPHELKSAFELLDGKIPSKLLKMWQKTQHRSLAEDFMISLMNVSDKKHMLISVAVPTHNGYSYHYQSQSQQTTAASNLNLLSKNSAAFLSNMSVSQKEEFFGVIAPFLAAEWFFDKKNTHFIKTLVTLLALPLQPQQKDMGLADAAWSDYISNLNQEEGLRSSEFTREWIESFNKWVKDVNEHSDLSNAEHVLKIGLAYLGNSHVKRNVHHKLIVEGASGIKKLISLGVKTQKIPARWTKNFDPELKSLVGAWVIEKVLSERKKTQQKIEDTAPRPRRRM